MKPLQDGESIAAVVRQAVADVTITDIHTHLFPPSHGPLLRWGIDELLVCQNLVAELFTVAPPSVTYERFWTLDKPIQSELIWEHLFQKRSPLSGARRGVLTALQALGLDAPGENLQTVRKWFAEQTLKEHLSKVFDLAGLDYAIMSNNPFLEIEVDFWSEIGNDCPPLKPALRIDPLLVDWPSAAGIMCASGFRTENLDEKSFAEARRFLAAWAKKIKPVYLAALLGSDFAYPIDSAAATAMRHIVLPAAEELGLPVALMIGVRKGVTPALGDGGDGVGVADVKAVQNLCAENPNVKFLVTMLSRVNQHELTALASKVRNLHLFGCWWFCDTPGIFNEMTRLRLELLGTAFTAQHSDAHVLDQLVYKWSHTRRLVGDILAETFVDLFDAGWRPTEKEIARETRRLFGGSFEEFLKK
jgi:hypothetical protein